MKFMIMFLMILRILSYFLIAMLTVWSVLVVFAFLIDISVIFPFQIVEKEELPMDRLHILRLAIISTFAFYGVMHLVNRREMIYPVHFLRTFLYFMSFMGAVIYINMHFKGEQISIFKILHVIWWFLIATILHLASLPKYRRLFGKK